MKKTSKLQEQKVRSLIREMVRRIVEEEEQQAADAEQGEDAAKQEPQAKAPAPPKPKPEPKKEEGLNPDFQAATDAMIQKLAQSTNTPMSADLIDMVSQVMERFTTSSEERLNILKGIRNNLVH